MGNLLDHKLHKPTLNTVYQIDYIDYKGYRISVLTSDLLSERFKVFK